MTNKDPVSIIYYIFLFNIFSDKMNKKTTWVLASVLAVAGLATGINSMFTNNQFSPKLAFITQSAFDCSQVTDVPKIECEALVALYDNTNGDSWHDNKNWKQTNTVCNWKGISCNNWFVLWLFLDSNQLSGPIPQEIGNLSRLKFLYLSENQLSGPIPSEFGNLSQLVNLLLDDNHLSGPIPSEFGNLSQLANLLLVDNQICGKIPEFLSNLSQLGGLWLYNNQLIIDGYTPEFVNWMQSKGFKFYTQDSKECEPVVPEGPYCIDKYDYYNNDKTPEYAWYTKRQLMASNDNELAEIIEQAEQKGVDPVCPTGKICDLNKDGKIDTKDLSFLEAILRDANEDDNTLIQLLIQAWLPVSCDAVAEPYCGDNICQASEKDKFGNILCEADCGKNPVVIKEPTTKTPTKDTWKGGFGGGKINPQ